MSNLIEELKRRNVIRVGLAYLVAAWVVLQIADLVLENIGAPDWVMQTLMLVSALGFPVVLLFSWAFELTPEGIKREKDVAHGESITRHTAHKLDRMTVGLLFVVVLLVVVERMVPGETAPEPAPETAAEAVAEKSIAVLAFQDLSPEGDQEYFAEGISEELLNVLAQIPDLKVAGRTSSFALTRGATSGRSARSWRRHISSKAPYGRPATVFVSPRSWSRRTTGSTCSPGTTTAS